MVIINGYCKTSYNLKKSSTNRTPDIKKKICYNFDILLSKYFILLNLLSVLKKINK